MITVAENGQRAPSKRVSRPLVGLLLLLLGVLGSVVALAIGLGRALENPILLLGSFLCGITGFVMTVVYLWRSRRAARRERT